MTKDQEVATEEVATIEAELDESVVDIEVSPEVEDSQEVSDELSVEQVGALLEAAQAKADEHQNHFMRVRAEMDNLRKRQERDLENAHKFALERFIGELIPVRDSMELGLGAAKEEGADIQKLLEGTELTLKLFADVMGKFNVEQIDPEGETFDPELHQAMSMQPRDDIAPNTVVVVVQKGYKLNGRLVRPAMVMVSQAVQ